MGLLTAVVAAVVWAVQVDLTERKFSAAACALGALVGFAMSRVAVPWRPLPFVAALIALAGCLLGDFFLDAALLGRAAGLGTLTTLQKMVTDPGLGRDVFRAGFEPMDALFWLIAAVFAYRFGSAALSALQAGRAVGGPVGVDAATFAAQPSPWIPPVPGAQPTPGGHPAQPGGYPPAGAYPPAQPPAGPYPPA